MTPHTLPAPPISPALEPYRWTVDEYDAMWQAGILTEESRVELLAGVITRKMGTGSVHDFVLGQLLTLVILSLGKSRTVRSQSPIALADSKPEPDLWVSKLPAGSHRDVTATAADIALVVEVADSLIKQDREVKLPLYAAAGIPEYWIVDVKKEVITVCTSPSGKTYDAEQVYGLADTFEHALAGSVAVAELFGVTPGRSA